MSALSSFSCHASCRLACGCEGRDCVVRVKVRGGGARERGRGRGRGGVGGGDMEGEEEEGRRRGGGGEGEGDSCRRASTRRACFARLRRTCDHR